MYIEDGEMASPAGGSFPKFKKVDDDGKPLKFTTLKFLCLECKEKGDPDCNCTNEDGSRKGDPVQKSIELYYWNHWSIGYQIGGSDSKWSNYEP